MAPEFGIPPLEELDPSKPDYAAKLDAGLIQLAQNGKALACDYQKLVNGKGESFVNFLKQKGFEAEHTHLSREEGADGLVHNLEMVEVGYDDRSRKADSQRINELVRSFSSGYSQKVQAIESKADSFHGVFGSYVSAALRLTQIQSLNKPSLDCPILHLFVVVPDELYEVQWPL